MRDCIERFCKLNIYRASACAPESNFANYASKANRSVVRWITFFTFLKNCCNMHKFPVRW